MPRIISDELFDSLMQCVKDQRLLGVMGKLERLKCESLEVENCGCEGGVDHGIYYLVEKEANGGPETNGD